MRKIIKPVKENEELKLSVKLWIQNLDDKTNVKSFSRNYQMSEKCIFCGQKKSLDKYIKTRTPLMYLMIFMCYTIYYNTYKFHP